MVVAPLGPPGSNRRGPAGPPHLDRLSARGGQLATAAGGGGGGGAFQSKPKPSATLEAQSGRNGEFPGLAHESVGAGIYFIEHISDIDLDGVAGGAPFPGVTEQGVQDSVAGARAVFVGLNAIVTAAGGNIGADKPAFERPVDVGIFRKQVEIILGMIVGLFADQCRLGQTFWLMKAEL